MQISSNMPNINSNLNVKEVKTNFTEKISNDEAKELKAQITKNSQMMMLKSVSVQGEVSTFSSDDKFAKGREDFQSFLKEIGYEGKPIAELSKEEATELVSEDGFFGVDKTAERIADFVINGSGGDEKMLRAGREGMLEGFKQAEEMWGGKLPDISQETMKKATEMVDKAMYDLGFSVMDQEA